ncbi:hypothetical protein KKH13_04670 [Patescibacteria group bacterium]|uniref:DUF1599 domain-containing protein n=1 Tax=viral metagenome TaxID=1070528 RepID=A0A6M3KPT1_9ZZZZ|nr:hypothetical protein [Patescibacteria group bacterium]
MRTITVGGRTQIAEKVFSDCLTILYTKGTDTAGITKDANLNFHKLAEDTGLTKYQIWLVYIKKHLFRLEGAIANGSLELKGESIKDSIRDIINYMVILESLIEEDKEDPSGNA